MAVGLPVIGPDIPAVREILNDGKEILLVKTEVDDISAKMIYFLENKIERELIARAGQEKIRSNYGWNNNTNKILSVIQKKLHADN